MADLLFDVGFLSYFPFCLKEAKVDKLKKGMEAKAWKKFAAIPFCNSVWFFDCPKGCLAKEKSFYI